ncbi:SMI1/KNR4 family protein [Saccharothrix obliqua]|uniref:SMI1/KNR4 family protein n=1 Tax=Saccharothrix obliqua TaxID=2861747 RepID=UPI001C5F4D3F|nr:SMI1/KNR4 family protein [Saccharothrix obliqua]MBW4717927.1 SMI1/KNR4 family protein [Saccharothrix obliqua]
MTLADERPFPPALAAVHEVVFDYEDGVDYEPYAAFLPADETGDWIRAWTGNHDLDGAEFRVLGQDGTGGLAAFWLVRPGADVVEQPVVFFGSEGELSVVARDLGEYLWLLAGGVGPREAAEYPDPDGLPHEHLREIAERFAPGRERPTADLLTAARAEFPDFESTVTALCRY